MISQNKIPGKSRGVSPVIATVILVAVAITVAVAVSYWMSGIAGPVSYTHLTLPTTPYV